MYMSTMFCIGHLSPSLSASSQSATVFWHSLLNAFIYLFLLFTAMIMIHPYCFCYFDQFPILSHTRTLWSISMEWMISNRYTPTKQKHIASITVFFLRSIKLHWLRIQVQFYLVNFCCCIFSVVCNNLSERIICDNVTRISCNKQLVELHWLRSILLGLIHPKPMKKQQIAFKVSELANDSNIFWW